VIRTRRANAIDKSSFETRLRASKPGDAPPSRSTPQL
jgi:hypothetical protein